MNNYPNPNRPAKGAGSFFSGILGCVFGGIFVFAFGLPLAITAAQGSLSIGGLIPLLVFFLLGLLLLVVSARKCALHNFGQRVRPVVAGKSRESLSLLAQVTGRDLTRLVSGLRQLSAKGYFPGAYVDLNRREFVVQSGGPLPPVFDNATVLREKRVHPAGPIYVMGGVWLVYALLFPFYRWYDFVIAAVLSVVALAAAARVMPERVIITEVTRAVEPPKPPEKINTGNEELDEVLTTAMAYMNELTALDVAITNPSIDKPVQELVHICKQIFDYIKKTPSKVRQIRPFMNYYLPTAIKLLKNYDELSREPVKGGNILNTMTKIEDAIGVILGAFQKELDHLYEDRAIDISVDIEVLQGMMEQEGLTGAAPKPDGAE